jgi:hypothetical protein
VSRSHEAFGLLSQSCSAADARALIERFLQFDIPAFKIAQILHPIPAFKIAQIYKNSGVVYESNVKQLVVTCCRHGGWQRCLTGGL